ncbi:hypothetical protein [Microbacterium sp.]|uniref:hypothetical protein n=1 Tax=Microbacterium sp. TaxID=51671 RepID=UPI003F9C4428
MTINIDKAIQDTGTFQLKLAAAAGHVGDGLRGLHAADIKQIKRELEDATGKKIIREGRPDRVTKKYIETVFADAVQRSLVVIVTKAGK